MGYTLEKVVPWGRNYEEYVAMFSLSTEDLSGLIIDCGAGPSSFNTTMSARGKRVISIDPLYQYSGEEISARIQETFPEVLEKARLYQENFIWDRISSVEELGNLRQLAMQDFLTDYESGKKQGRYLHAELPVLTFDDNMFDLALSSHFLFLYTEQLSPEFHLRAVEAMCRVAREVRIFPLLDLNAERSPYVDLVFHQLSDQGKRVTLEKVAYEFQKGGDTMMRIVT